MFRGSIVALITPFRNGAIDEKSLRDLVDWHVDEGTHAIVPVGTTGESPTLSHDEHKQVIEIAIDQVAGRIPVIAGTGSNSTAEAIDFTVHAKKAGADAALVVTPYYNKPTQAGLYAHYRAIVDAVDIPVIIYNIPSRSVVDMSVETMAEARQIAQHRRRQGFDRGHGSPVAHHDVLRSGVLSAHRRRRQCRRLPCPWRTWCDLGDRKCGPSPLRRAACRLAARRRGRRRWPFIEG